MGLRLELTDCGRVSSNRFFLVVSDSVEWGMRMGFVLCGGTKWEDFTRRGTKGVAERLGGLR